MAILRNNHFCPTCASRFLKVYYRYKSFDVYEKKVGINFSNSFKRIWLLCNACGFIFSNYHFENSKNLIKIYKNDYRDISEESIKRLYKKVLHISFANSENKQREKLIKNYIKALKIKKIFSLKNLNHLDIGGGSGVFAAQFKDSSWTSSVMDLSRENFMTKKKNIKFFTEDLLKLKKFRTKYSLVTLINTLEHVKDFYKFLKKIKKALLKKNGILFVECPASYNFKRLNINHEIFNSCHLNMWNFYNFSIVMKKAGFEILHFINSKEIRGHYSYKCFMRPL